MKRLAIALGTGMAMAVVAVTTHPSQAPALEQEPGTFAHDMQAAMAAQPTDRRVSPE